MASNGGSGLLRAIHDDVVGRGEYRSKGDHETLYQWWQSYMHDVLGDSLDIAWVRGGGAS